MFVSSFVSRNYAKTHINSNKSLTYIEINNLIKILFGIGVQRLEKMVRKKTVKSLCPKFTFWSTPVPN